MFTAEIENYIDQRNGNLTVSELKEIMHSSPQILYATFHGGFWKYVLYTKEGKEMKFNLVR